MAKKNQRLSKAKPLIEEKDEFRGKLYRCEKKKIRASCL